ncbi:ATP-grasp domain-containing protein [Schaalia sp. ZJ405]|uniref:ATP-binding protein n=1 Tax=Schaalia sp. ZJ405 TaxID=2709403 RepID=UPI0013EC5CFE|nr:biotin carboxylase N-terminal domain-containing protein [Schaalia sp. ZJ405]QPK81933.1 ATP-grasp domain-containing protein [Schaalia sp. ZJ405]
MNTRRDDLPTHHTQGRPIRTILVANRGEVAVRVIRTAHDMGIRAVVAYSDQDIDSLACELADEALALGGRSLAETYLNTDALIDVARRAGADAIHPGYGFLSENADFAQAVEDAGITWLGPSAEVIRALGDKISARDIAVRTGVPIIPGTRIDGTVNVAERIDSFPVLIKRADSGGGRGITRIDSAEDLNRFLAEHADPSELDGCFIEKLVTNARHVETQCLRDAHGNFHVVSTRDCSVQRRNQKIIEEAPAPFLCADVEERLREYSRALFEATDYRGVGTCEFLVDNNDVYFLEVNPRLQVEHTVSEEITGIDLVGEQIRIACGDVVGEIPSTRGHSIEVRVTSENPADNLMPSTGTITSISWPGGPGVRIDGFIRPGDAIGTDYDSLIAKLIVTAPTREQALARLRRALSEFHVSGVATCRALIDTILADPAFAGDEDDFAVHTAWCETSGLLDRMKPQHIQAADAEPMLDAELTSVPVEIDGRRVSLRLPLRALSAIAEVGRSSTPSVAGSGDTPVRARPQVLRGRGRAGFTGSASTLGAAPHGPNVHAPIQGTVVKVVASQGDIVTEGDLIVVLESMKMEKPVHATVSGRVGTLRVSPGDSVKAGDELAVIIEEEQ